MRLSAAWAAEAKIASAAADATKVPSVARPAARAKREEEKPAFAPKALAAFIEAIPLPDDVFTVRVFTRLYPLALVSSRVGLLAERIKQRFTVSQSRLA